jgi:hypothetical protein
MDPITQKLAPGAAGFIPTHYVDDVFSTDTWFGTGTGANTPANKKITNGINMSKYGGMVLNFQRGNLSGSYGSSHYKGISDTDIGTGKRFWPLSNTNQLGTQADAMQSFDSDGWTMGVNVFMNEGNGDNSNSSQNGAYTFRKQPGFFDMVTFTTGTDASRQSNRRIPHSLGCKVGFMILKNQNSTQDYYVFHCKQQGGGANDYAKFNQTDNWTGSSDIWGPQGSDTTDDFGVNENAVWFVQNSTYSVWLWADGDDPNAKIFGKDRDSEIVKAVKGGGANTLTDLGWEPQMLLIKNSSSDWCWVDDVRGYASQTEMNMYSVGYNAPITQSNNESGEQSYTVGFNMKGFFQGTFGGDTWCLAIRRPDAKVGKWAESPNECTQLYKGTSNAGNRITLNNVTSGFGRFDMMFNMRRYDEVSYNPTLQTTNRMMSGSSNPDGGAGTSNSGSGFSRWYLNMHTTNHQGNIQATERDVRYDITDEDAYIPWDGFLNGNNGPQHMFYMFKRKPGFFDMFKYTADSPSFVEPALTHTPHQLGVQPDLVIVKSLSSNTSYGSYGQKWIVWSKAAGAAGVHDEKYNTCYIDGTTIGTRYIMWGDTIADALTAETVRIQPGIINHSGTNGYMMYLFANCSGVFHTGIYTGAGEGTPVDVTEVGFSPRILMLKNISTTGCWWVYDTTRGLSSDNDPYLWWNAEVRQVSGTDYVDPLSNGFQITNTAPGDSSIKLNVSGEKVLYLAFA